MAHMFEYVVPSGWTCLGRARRYDFFGEGVLLGKGSEVLEAHAILNLSLFASTFWIRM